MPDPHDILHTSLKRILEQRETLSRETSRALLDNILDRTQHAVLPEGQIRIAALFAALAARGETIDELAGFVDALRARVIRIPLTEPERSLVVDTCGTGGDLSGTFNISTAAGLVAAAAGARVAKHGNRAVTSSCGSADVLEALGIPVDQTPAQAADALRTHNFAFLAAPSLQPAMKSIMPIRRAIGVRTAFNILGPMTNPAFAPAQVIGVYSAALVPIVAHTLARLDTRHAFVVHGFDTATGAGSARGQFGIDEFSISGPTSVGEVLRGKVKFFTVTPADFGVPLAPIGALVGGNAEVNAQILRAIFSGEPGPRRDVVIINAAAVLVTVGLAANFLDAVRLAQVTIDSGSVSHLVEALGT